MNKDIVTVKDFIELFEARLEIERLKNDTLHPYDLKNELFDEILTEINEGEDSPLRKRFIEIGKKENLDDEERSDLDRLNTMVTGNE